MDVRQINDLLFAAEFSAETIKESTTMRTTRSLLLAALLLLSLVLSAVPVAAQSDEPVASSHSSLPKSTGPSLQSVSNCQSLDAWVNVYRDGTIRFRIDFNQCAGTVTWTLNASGQSRTGTKQIEGDGSTHLYWDDNDIHMTDGEVAVGNVNVNGTSLPEIRVVYNSQQWPVFMSLTQHSCLANIVGHTDPHIYTDNGAGVISHFVRTDENWRIDSIPLAQVNGERLFRARAFDTEQSDPFGPNVSPSDPRADISWKLTLACAPITPTLPAITPTTPITPTLPAITPTTPITPTLPAITPTPITPTLPAITPTTPITPTLPAITPTTPRGGDNPTSTPTEVTCPADQRRPGGRCADETEYRLVGVLYETCSGVHAEFWFVDKDGTTVVSGYHHISAAAFSIPGYDRTSTLDRAIALRAHSPEVIERLNGQPSRWRLSWGWSFLQEQWWNADRVNGLHIVVKDSDDLYIHGPDTIVWSELVNPTYVEGVCKFSSTATPLPPTDTPVLTTVPTTTPQIDPTNTRVPRPPETPKAATGSLGLDLAQTNSAPADLVPARSMNSAQAEQPTDPWKSVSDNMWIAGVVLLVAAFIASRVRRSSSR